MASFGLVELWDRKIEPDLRAFQARVARIALRQEQGRGFTQHPLRIVDGRKGAIEESVRWGGRIEYVGDVPIRGMVEAILAELIKRSPVGREQKQKAARPGHPGLYQSSHRVTVNGVSIASPAELDRLKPGDEIRMVNTVVYASKIEGADAGSRWMRGARSKRGKKRTKGIAAKNTLGRSARNGVYRVVWRWAQARYGRLAKFTFEPTKLEGGALVSGSRGLRAQIYPSLLIVPTVFRT